MNYNYRNLSKEMQWLYEEIFIHGTKYKTLLNDGFTLEEINLCLKQGGLRPITLRKKS